MVIIVALFEKVLRNNEIIKTIKRIQFHYVPYNWLITKLNSDGFHVISADHKGHGIGINNGDMPGYFANQNGWELVTINLRELILSTNDKYPNLNQFLIGHSMGSWIALSAIQKPLPIKGLILTGSSKIPNS